jgi:hypothetical protein
MWQALQKPSNSKSYYYLNLPGNILVYTVCPPDLKGPHHVNVIAEHIIHGESPSIDC